MEKALQVFEYKGTQVRTVERDGEIWFVAKDVCNVLEIADYHQAVETLDDDERGRYSVPTPGGMQTMTVISEPGLYALVLKSRKAEAKDFSRWVRHDVLMQIAHTGSYNTRQTLAEDLKAVQVVLEPAGIEGNQLTLALDRAYKKFTGYSALALTDTQLTAPTKHQLLTPTEIGSQFGISARRVNEILAGAGYQYKVGEKWEPLELGKPYSVMLDVGKKHGGGVPVRQLKWDSSILPVFKEMMEVSA